VRRRAPARTNKVLVRLGVDTDVPSIASLVERYWQVEGIGGFDRTAVEATLRSLLSGPERGGCWVAEEDSELCGYLTAVYMLSLEHGGVMAEIDEIFVQPKLRSSGVGTLLIVAAERVMAAQGLVRLQLQLGIDNHRGRRFYERHGFHRRSGYELFDKPLQLQAQGK
jgi:GNAT superfamily N-acetyltransferase